MNYTDVVIVHNVPMTGEEMLDLFEYVAFYALQGVYKKNMHTSFLSHIYSCQCTFSILNILKKVCTVQPIQHMHIIL